jgi:hypothetical protein
MKSKWLLSALTYLLAHPQLTHQRQRRRCINESLAFFFDSPMGLTSGLPDSAFDQEKSFDDKTKKLPIQTYGQQCKAIFWEYCSFDNSFQ